MSLVERPEVARNTEDAKAESENSYTYGEEEYYDEEDGEEDAEHNLSQSHDSRRSQTSADKRLARMRQANK